MKNAWKRPKKAETQCKSGCQEPRCLVPRPVTWSHRDAAALPTVFTTVHLAFKELAKLQAGQHVLVHAAAGGVGLTAVQYALAIGAVVYATAGSREKPEYLKDLGVLKARHLSVDIVGL